MADDDTMTTTEVAGYLGVTRNAAGKWLKRRRIEPCGRGLDGQYLYPRSKVLSAIRSQRGRRTDLEDLPPALT